MLIALAAAALFDCHAQEADLPSSNVRIAPGSAGTQADASASTPSDAGNGALDAGAAGFSPATNAAGAPAQGGSSNPGEEAPSLAGSSFAPAEEATAGAGGDRSGAGGDRSDAGCERGVDTDRDEWDDCDDDDADDDGLANADDEKPLDPTLPAGRPNSAPNSVLSDPCVLRALDEYALKREVDTTLPELVVHREHRLPDQTGYYRTATRLGQIVTGSDNPEPGPLRGGEVFLKRKSEDGYDNWGLDFDTGPIGYWASPSHVHRGTAQKFTHYVRDPAMVFITSGAMSSTGSLSDQTLISVQVSESGVYPDDQCGAPYGYWRVFFTSFTQKVTVSELSFMCTDSEKQAGYVPPQVWYEQGGKRCECMPEFVTQCL